MRRIEPTKMKLHKAVRGMHCCDEMGVMFCEAREDGLSHQCVRGDRVDQGQELFCENGLSRMCCKGTFGMCCSSIGACSG